MRATFSVVIPEAGLPEISDFVRKARYSGSRASSSES